MHHDVTFVSSGTSASMILTIVGATAIAISTSKIILAGSKVGPTTPRKLNHVYLKN